MSAKHALLGLLLDKPAYPYQLARRLQDRLGPAWKVNSGQLYNAIGALERARLIERVESEGDGEERHVFAITDAGVGEFERFFEEASDGVRLSRRPLLLKITFAGPQRLGEALAKLDEYEQECARQLAHVSELRDELPDSGMLRADHLLLRLNLSADIAQLEGELQWSRGAREMLAWLAGRKAVWPLERGAGARRELFTRVAGAEKTPASKGRRGKGE